MKKAKEYQYYKEEYDVILGKLGTELGNELKDKMFYSEVVVGLLRGENKNAILDAHKMSAHLIEKHPFLKALKDTYGNKNFREYAKELLSDYLKKANAYFLATKNAKIDAGKNLSNRNVATYRMASMMGISRLLVRSDTADVYDGEERIQGMMMEEAQGETAAKHHIHGKEYYLKYTDDTVSDIITMQIFDYICGQVDRNNTNYFLTEMDGKLINLKMIDNDMAMGRLLPKNIQNKVLQLRVPDLGAIRAMPQATKERIIEIAKNGKEYLKFFLGDILDSNEIEAAYERLKYISDEIEEDDKKLSELKNKKISMQNQDEWTNLRDAELCRKPELQPIFYMYSLYKEAQEHYKTENNQTLVSYCEKYIKDHSYLNLDHMPIFEDLERIIEDERKKWENEKTSKVPE
ncbi:MAG: hypothetical protein K6E91_09945 [Butyrivibrio sp.]|nr:hypothetical protein [Butyrivibrio sp.]